MVIPDLVHVSFLQTEGGAVVYENMMSSTFAVIGGPAGSITRDSFYK